MFPEKPQIFNRSLREKYSRAQGKMSENDQVFKK